MATIRNTFLRDYGINEQEAEELLNYCRFAGAMEQKIVLKAAQMANDSIAVPIFVNLTTGIGYDRLNDWIEIPMQRKDFQGYRRKALSVLRSLIKSSEKAELN